MVPIQKKLVTQGYLDRFTFRCKVDDNFEEGVVRRTPNLSGALRTGVPQTDANAITFGILDCPIQFASYYSATHLEWRYNLRRQRRGIRQRLSIRNIENEHYWPHRQQRT